MIEYSFIEEQKQYPVLIQDILSAISNSIIDTYTKLYLLDSNKYVNNISNCRNRLKELKEILPQKGMIYDQYIAFQHTEIDLEYCESLIAMEKDDLEQAALKIQEANKRLENILLTKGFITYEPFETSKKNIRKQANLLLRRDAKQSLT